MPTRNVVLTDHQAEFLDSLVAEGRFQNASEAMRTGLRMLQDDEDRRRGVVARIMESYAQAQRGELVAGDGLEILRRMADARFGGN